jgi:type VI secretion system secreted protein VgrG
MAAVPATTAHFALHGEGLPSDALPSAFRATEKLSTPYEVVVELTTSDPDFMADSLLRKQLTLEVVDDAGGQRLFDGVVDAAELVDVVAQVHYLRFRLRPAMASLAHRKNSRIFQEKNVVAIIQTIFKDAGFDDKVDWLTTATYEPIEYLVQYRESDLDFVHRLMEKYGIFYWFGHSADGHKMAIADDPKSFASRDDTPPTHFTMTQGSASGGEPLLKFRRKRSLRTGLVHLRDYDFKKPQQPPEATLPAEDSAPAEYFEYPAGFVSGKDGQLVANARMRSLRRDADVCEGESHAIGLRVGVPFSVSGAAEEDLNGDFVCTELVTTGSQQDSGASGSHACQNLFRGIPEGAAFAAERKTPWPRVHGVQTATVTGSSTQAQTIHVDEFGRIKVRFHWDRESPQDHTSSCWIRVAQVGMGGSMILPRVGWEVSVAFLDGDPDRPVVLGRVYNGEKVPPMGLPGAKTSGVLKSWISPGAGGHNELSFGDSGGGQGFNVHAQKDFNVTVGNNKTESVGVDEKHKVSVNESASVGGNETIDVSGDQKIDVGANLEQNVGGAQTIKVGGNDVSNSTANFVEKIDASRSHSVGGNTMVIQNGIRYEVSGDMSVKVGSLEMLGSIAPIQENISGNYTHDAGAVTVHLAKGTANEVIAGDKNVTYAAAQLHLTKGGITQSTGANTTNLVGGLHYQKLDGDLVIKGPLVTLIGAVGVFKGGGSELKLGGGPIVVKGSTIAVEGALVVKMAGQLKMA